MNYRILKSTTFIFILLYSNLDMSSNWKLLANKSLERNRSLSSKKNSNTKYKPRKQERTPRDSSFISPSIMNSFSRADSSSMIGIQDREEKFS